MIEAINKITIYVENQATAKQFWLEKMAFVVALEQPMGPALTWLEVSPKVDSQTTFVLYERAVMLAHNPSANVAHPSIMLSTTAIEQTHATLQANGVDVDELLIMPYGKMFKFRDQDEQEYLIRESN